MKIRSQPKAGPSPFFFFFFFFFFFNFFIRWETVRGQRILSPCLKRLANFFFQWCAFRQRKLLEVRRNCVFVWYDKFQLCSLPGLQAECFRSCIMQDPAPWHISLLVMNECRLSPLVPVNQLSSGHTFYSLMQEAGNGGFYPEPTSMQALSIIHASTLTYKLKTCASFPAKLVMSDCSVLVVGPVNKLPSPVHTFRLFPRNR